ncbi:MAG: DUF3842 family protein, partial [Sphaerochaetaceae bacterium]|nr:DUF3842 family protein [Sphaerochaetaceae bacterium]
VIDGQGGSLGKNIVEQLKARLVGHEITVVGTNGLATSNMLKGGATYGATGENPVLVACRHADIIIGPMGILAADSLLGEITPAMALAIGQSHAHKILIPVNRCCITVAGTQDLPYGDYIRLAVEKVEELCGGGR